MGRKVLQSQFYNFMEDVGSGNDHLNPTQVGIITLDSWLVSIKGNITSSAGIAAGKQGIISLGIQSQPVALPGRWDDSISGDYNDIWEPYLAATLEGMFLFGPANKMPLFHLMITDGVLLETGEVVNFKKIFRKGIWSGDELNIYESKQTIEGAADTAARNVYKLQLKQVIAPSRW